MPNILIRKKFHNLILSFFCNYVIERVKLSISIFFQHEVAFKRERERCRKQEQQTTILP